MDDITAKQEKNLAVIGRLLAGFSTGQTAHIDELVHDNFVNHHAPEGMRDKAGFKEIVRMVHSSFSSFDEFDLKPVHMFAHGDMVAMLDVGKGMRKGQEYLHRDIHIFRMENGQMREHWNSFNLPCQRDVLMKLMEETK